MGTLIQDLRYAARMMLKQKGFTVVAIAALALGIGANTAIFTVVNAGVLRPLPYDDPDHLVWLSDTQPQLATAPASLPDFIDWRDQNHSFEYLAAYKNQNPNEKPENLNQERAVCTGVLIEDHRWTDWSHSSKATSV